MAKLANPIPGPSASIFRSAGRSETWICLTSAASLVFLQFCSKASHDSNTPPPGSGLVISCHHAAPWRATERRDGNWRAMTSATPPVVGYVRGMITIQKGRHERLTGMPGTSSWVPPFAIGGRTADKVRLVRDAAVHHPDVCALTGTPLFRRAAWRCAQSVDRRDRGVPRARDDRRQRARDRCAATSVRAVPRVSRAQARRHRAVCARGRRRAEAWR
jgi:hypothetical protein